MFKLVQDVNRTTSADNGFDTVCHRGYSDLYPLQLLRGEKRREREPTKQPQVAAQEQRGLDKWKTEQLVLLELHQPAEQTLLQCEREREHEQPIYFPLLHGQVNQTLCFK